jgi:putative glycerol-1-phosphate prenyltransferase
MKIYEYLLNTIKNKGAAYLILIDPDKLQHNKIAAFVSNCEKAKVDGFLIGGSLMMNGDFNEFVKLFKDKTKLPKIIFPGEVGQVSEYADALLYISLISGRNPEHLIGKHILAAPIIKRIGIEPISTGYMLIESGAKTTAEYISGSVPIPRNKPEIAAATALAAQYMGMKLVYLEAGSGAENHVPFEMVKTVSSYCDIPVIVGGGIRTPDTANKMILSGAKIVVTGNHFEDENNWKLLKEFADAVHIRNSMTI